LGRRDRFAAVVPAIIAAILPVVAAVVAPFLPRRVLPRRRVLLLRVT
jgi:hypothetical protein